MKKHFSVQRTSLPEERESKANDFVAVLPSRCLLAKRFKQLGSRLAVANGHRARAWHS